MPSQHNQLRICFFLSHISMFLTLLPLLSSVSAHGGMLWPPIWQDGVGLPIDQLWVHYVSSDPKVRDPNSGKAYINTKVWLTDVAYTGGIGEEFMGIGPVTNGYNKNLKKNDRCGYWCVKKRQPWAAPGLTPSLGGGCGVFGGNPDGCPAHKDNRPPGSVCGQEKNRGTSSFGSDARFVEFPQMITTEWEIGSVQDVAWSSSGSHKGGYTYRLCKLGSDGRPGLTEECFASNVLSFASNFTMIKSHERRGNGTWEKFEQTDLREGTFPEGSVWRPVGKVVKKWFVIRCFVNLARRQNSLLSIIRKDSVLVPADLPAGDYVLSLRWDVWGGAQVAFPAVSK